MLHARLPLRSDSANNQSHVGISAHLYPLAKLIAGASVCVLLASCGQPNAQGAGGPPGAPPVSVAPAVERSIPDETTFSGRLEADENVELRSRIAGEIVKVHFRDGQDVKKGDLLFSIDARPYKAELAKAEAQLATARTQASLAKSEAVRGQKLFEVKAISKQELDQLNSSAANAEASIQSAQAAVQSARLNVEYCEIHSPIDGRISRTQATVGNMVGNGTPVLTTIVSQNKVYAYFEASEQTYLQYAKELHTNTPSKNAAVWMGLANEDDYPHRGHIDFVDNRLDPQSATMRLRATFDNAKRQFMPGMVAKLKLVSNETHPAVMIPDRAIGTDQTKKFVLVVGDDKTAQYRPVQLGSLLDGMRVITNGLQAGENIIVNGLQRAHPGAPVMPEVLQVDDKGMPIEPAPQQQGNPAQQKDGKK